MNSKLKKMAKEIVKINEKTKTKPQPYDTSGIVKRIEGNTAYVQFQGADEETPVDMTINCKTGDNVKLRISNRRAWITGNSTAPPTDDAAANVAKTTAEKATTIAITAKEVADVAEEEAGRAKDAADRAEEKADIAAAAADRAEEKADIAAAAADRAEEKADIASAAADRAETEAGRATTYANNALAGLSTLESVVDTVNWFAEHKKASTDVTVDPSKTYYIYNASTGTLSEAHPEGTENPSQEGWYELNEAISDYVASHVAVTNDGLYVVNLSGGWKILISSGGGNYTTGVFLIDPNGNIAQATTSNGITFDEDKPFYIGDNNAYLVFDGNGNIQLGGSINFNGTKTLTEVLNQLGASIKSVEYGVGSSPTSHSDISSWSTSTPTWTPGTYIWMRTTTNGLQYTYTCIQGAKGEDGEDAVNMSILSTEGTVFKSNTANTRLDVYLYHGGTEITTKSVLEQHFGVGTYLQWEVKKYGDQSPTTIPSTYPYLSNDGFSLTVHAEDVNTWTVYNVKIITP